VRLPPLAPEEMSPELRSFHDGIAEVVAQHLKGFVSTREDGALVGPFAPMLHFPQFGRTAWALSKALMDHSKLPRGAHEVAILVTGARFNARYEIYAHERVAEQAGLSEAKIATIAAGERPADLTEEEAAAYDVTAVLMAGKQLSETTYRRALKAFGQEQVAELVYLVGSYSLVSVLLNAYDVSVPGREEGLPDG
jgi:4-carboxymuconolactone decarboxylase